MRILAMTNLYPNPYQPNRATFNRNRLRILGERCPVRVIAPIAWTDEFRSRRNGMKALPKGRCLTLDGMTVDHPRYYFPPRIGRGWYGSFYLASVKATFRRVVREFKPDLIFTTWAYPDGWAGIRLGHRAGLPVVLQVHGSDILLLDRFPARRRRTIEAVHSADGIIAVSRDLTETLVRLGVKPEKIRTIHDGVDRKLFHPGDKAQERAILNLSAEEKVILFVGNLVPVKAVDVLIRASAELMQEDKRIRLIIVGQGPLRTELDRLARERGIVDRVRFAGSLPHAELPRWFRAADLFVLPSHSEGVPNVLLEASACGVPWVASRVGGIPEIAHLGISRLVTPNAPSELARAIRESLAAPRKELPPGPRSREEAVADLHSWLNAVLNR